MENKKQLPQTEKTLGRRELLKALAATGGAVTAAAMLPGQWAKPVIEAGVLPAHAQSSAIVISSLRFQPNITSADIAGPTGTIDYNDGLGMIDGNAELSWKWEPQDPLPAEADAQLLGGSATEMVSDLTQNGNGYSGTITFPLLGFDDLDVDAYACVPLKITVNYLKASDGRMSGSISNTYDPGCN